MPEAMNLHKETIRALGREISKVITEQTRLCVEGNREDAAELNSKLFELLDQRSRARSERATEAHSASTGQSDTSEDYYNYLVEEAHRE